jgi:NAD(P) transhydrogenase
MYAIQELSSVGMTEAQARDAHGDVSVGFAEFSEVARGLIAQSSDGMLKLIAYANNERI